MSADRFKNAIAAIVDELLPERRFLAPAEYRVDKCEGGKLTAKPAKDASGLPPLIDIPIRGSIAGGMSASKLKKGTSVIVMWIDGSPARPFLMAIDAKEEPDELALEGQSLLSLKGGGLEPSEHVITTEAVILAFYNVLVTWCAAAGGGPLLAVVLQPLILPSILAGLTVQGAPAPVGLVAQTAADAVNAGAMAPGTTPSQSLGALAAGLALIDAKVSDVSGKFPGLGAPKVKAG